MSVDLPASVKLLSSIAGELGPTQAVDTRSNPSADPLDGSLGPYVVTCSVVLLLVLGVAAILWRIHIHRVPRANRALAGHAAPTVSDSVSYLPSFWGSTLTVNTVDSSIKFPPNSLRVRTPIQRLRLFRAETRESLGGSTAVPLWTSPTMQHAPAVPSIVISQCSPALPIQDTFTTTASASTDILQTPATSSSATAAPSTPSEEVLTVVAEATNTPLEATSMVPSYKPCVPSPKKVAPNRVAKRTHRRGRPIGKENAAPAASPHLSPTEVWRPQRVFGLRQ